MSFLVSQRTTFWRKIQGQILSPVIFVQACSSQWGSVHVIELRIFQYYTYGRLNMLKSLFKDIKNKTCKTHALSVIMLIILSVILGLVRLPLKSTVNSVINFSGSGIEPILFSLFRFLFFS